MRVKLLLLGIAYFLCILDQTYASHKCYRAKICIHDGKEKCGQDKGEVRRFLDSCDIKEYNCLRDTNFVKTNSVKCRNLPPIDKTPLADDKASDDDRIENEGNEESKVDDESNEANIVEKVAKVSKDDRVDEVTQEEIENDGSDEGDDAKGSTKNTSDKKNKVDDTDQVNIEEKNDESNVEENVKESKEDRADRASQEIENEGANQEEDSVKGNTKNASDKASKVDKVDEVDREEKNYEEGEENASRASKEDGANKASKENGSNEKNKMNQIDVDEANQDNASKNQNDNNDDGGADGASNKDKEISSDQENEAKGKILEETVGSQVKNTAEKKNRRRTRLHFITRSRNTRMTIHPSQAAVINEYWCWRTKYCHSTGGVVCGRDRRLNERRKFNSACDLYQHNCDEGHNFTITDIKYCKGY